MRIRQKSFEDYCPVCQICGERITDDFFRQIGTDTYHDGCIETKTTDIYVDNQRAEDEIYGEDR